MMMVNVGYPEKQEEVEIVRRTTVGQLIDQSRIEARALIKLQELVEPAGG